MSPPYCSSYPSPVVVLTLHVGPKKLSTINCTSEIFLAILPIFTQSRISQDLALRPSPRCIRMTCRNLCERLYFKVIVGKSRYQRGKKYCRRCEVYFLHDDSFCHCCGIRLRLSPVNKRDRNMRFEIFS